MLPAFVPGVRGRSGAYVCPVNGLCTIIAVVARLHVCTQRRYSGGHHQHLVFTIAANGSVLPLLEATGHN